MIERVSPPTTGDERATLIGFLDYYRATFALKCDGLNPERLARRAVPPSNLSMLGLLRHLGDFERGWFRGFAGEETASVYCTADNPDGDFEDARPEIDGAIDAVAFWQLEVENSQRITAAHGLDDTYWRDRDGGQTISLRWILVHAIEEYARHCGHADFLREVIDGVTGD